MSAVECYDIFTVVESLRSMVETTENDEQLASRLDVYLTKYLMDVESSKRAVIKDLGGTDRDYICPEEPDVSLCDLNIKRGATITFVAKVTNIAHRDTRSGKRIYTASVRDETGSAKIIQWDHPFNFEMNKVYRFRNWKADYDYYEKITILAPRNSSVEELFDITITSSDYTENVKYALSSDSFGDDPMKDITVAGYVVVFTHKSPGSRAPAKGTLRIDGLTVPFVSWDDRDISSGDRVCITHADYEYNNYEKRMQLKISGRSDIFKGE